MEEVGTAIEQYFNQLIHMRLLSQVFISDRQGNTILTCFGPADTANNANVPTPTTATHTDTNNNNNAAAATEEMMTESNVVLSGARCFQNFDQLQLGTPVYISAQFHDAVVVQFVDRSCLVTLLGSRAQGHFVGGLLALMPQIRASSVYEELVRKMACELVARVSNLSPHVTRAHLTALLQDHMKIKEIHLPAPCLWLSCPTGKAEVIGESEEDTARVYVYLHGAALDGHRVAVQLVRVDPTLPPEDKKSTADDVKKVSEPVMMTTKATMSTTGATEQQSTTSAQRDRHRGRRHARSSRSRSRRRHRRSSSLRRRHYSDDDDDDDEGSRPHQRRHRERSRYERRRHSSSRSRSASSAASSRRRHHHRSHRRERGRDESRRTDDSRVVAARMTRSGSQTVLPVRDAATRSPSPEWD